MSNRHFLIHSRRAVAILAGIAAPGLVLAQQSPFQTGANSLLTNAVAIATPIAIVIAMILGGLAMAKQLSWAWPLSALAGVAILFGAPQLVTWARTLFAV